MDQRRDSKRASTERPVDPESLAALAEGALDGEKRRVALGSLRDSPLARELFADIVALSRSFRSRVRRSKH